MVNRETDTNKRTWDIVAPHYYGRTALPEWGAFAIERDNPSLIGEIKGKVFLELACGSGHSIQYLIENGAAKVYGLDLSHTQVTFAAQTNEEAVRQGKVILFEQPMEDPVVLPEPVDTVFSIYGLGWAIDLDKVLQNVNACLRMGGRFVWSWDHPIYPCVEYDDGKFSVTRSYHDEGLKPEKSWGTDEGRYIAPRKISTWYNSLRKHGFDVVKMLEPTPFEIREHEQNPAKYYSSAKANLVPATMIFECIKVSQPS